MDGIGVVEGEDDDPPRARQILRHTHVLSDKSMKLTFSNQGHLVRIVEEEGVLMGDVPMAVASNSELGEEKYSMLYAAMCCALLQFMLIFLLL